MGSLLWGLPGLLSYEDFNDEGNCLRLPVASNNSHQLATLVELEPKKRASGGVQLLLLCFLFHHGGTVVRKSVRCDCGGFWELPTEPDIIPCYMIQYSSSYGLRGRRFSKIFLNSQSTIHRPLLCKKVQKGEQSETDVIGTRLSHLQSQETPTTTTPTS